jgi:hypothetical protein
MSHARDRAEQAGLIRNRQRTGFANADESLRFAPRGFDLRAGRMRGWQCVSRPRMQDNAIKRRNFSRNGKQSIGSGALTGHDNLGGA